MTFTKALTPSKIPFGVYRIDTNYLDELRKTDKNVGVLNLPGGK